MKYQILSSGKKKKSIISLSSAEFAHRVIKVKNNKWPSLNVLDIAEGLKIRLSVFCLFCSVIQFVNLLPLIQKYS